MLCVADLAIARMLDLKTGARRAHGAAVRAATSQGKFPSTADK
ncbi:hypothetical protein WME99_40365 [Sorangium sp. So ce136]